MQQVLVKSKLVFKLECPRCFGHDVEVGTIICGEQMYFCVDCKCWFGESRRTRGFIQELDHIDVRLPKEIVKSLKDFCDKNGFCLKTVIEKAVRDLIEKEAEQQKEDTKERPEIKLTRFGFIQPV